MEIAAVVARVQLQMDDFNRGLAQVRQALAQLNAATDAASARLRTAFTQAAPGAQSLASSLSSARGAADTLASTASRIGTAISRSLGSAEYSARTASSSVRNLDTALKGLQPTPVNRLSDAFRSATAENTTLASSLKQTGAAASSFDRIAASARAAASAVTAFNAELTVASLRLTTLGAAAASMSSLRLQAGMAASELASIGTAAAAAQAQSTAAAAAMGAAIGTAASSFRAFGSITRETIEQYGEFVEKLAEWQEKTKKQVWTLSLEEYLREVAKALDITERQARLLHERYNARELFSLGIAQLEDVFSRDIPNRAQQAARALRATFQGAWQSFVSDARIAMDQTRNSLHQFAYSAESILDRLSSSGKNLFLGGAAAGGALFLSARHFADFDHQLTRIAVLSGVAKSQVEPLRHEIVRLAPAFGYTTREAAEAGAQMAAAGYSFGQIRETLPAAMAAAAASGEDLSLVSELLVGQLAAFSSQGLKASHAADVLAQATNLSAIGMQDLAYSLKYAGPVAAAAGISFDELAAAIAVMGNQGIKGEQAGTTLRAALLRLIDPPREAAQMLHQLGIAVTDTQGRMLPLALIIEQLEKATQGMSQAQRLAVLSTIFSTEAASGMLAIINQGSDTLKRFTVELMASDGVAAKMAKDMQSDLWGALNRVRIAFDLLVDTIGRSVAPYVHVVANALATLATALSHMPEPIQRVLGALAFLGTTLLTVGGVSMVLTAILPRLWAVCAAGINVVRALAVAFIELRWRTLLAYGAIALIIYGLSRLFGGFKPSIDTSQLAADTAKVNQYLANLYKGVQPGPVVSVPGTEKSGVAEAEAAKEAWQKSLDAIANRLTTLKAQMDVATASLPAQASEAEKLAAQLNYLNQMYALQSQAVSILASAYRRYLSAYGEADTRTAAVAEAYAKEYRRLRELEEAIKSASASLNTYGQSVEALKAQLSLLEVEHVRSLASLGAFATSLQKLQADLNYYQRALEVQRDLVSALQARYEALKASLGEAAEATRSVYAEWVSAQAAQVNLERAIARTNASIQQQQREMQALTNQVADITKRYHEDLAKAQREYEDRVREANDRLKREEKNLTERYQEELRRRLIAIRDFTRLFDAIQHTKVKPQTLLGNLQDQVAVLKNFYADLATLQKRGVDESLIEYLRELGPGVADEVRALTLMTDEELALYVQLWREKNALAGEQATKETESTRQDINAQIEELRRETAEQLEKYKQEWLDKQAEIRARTVEELQRLLDDAGAYGQGFVDQLAAGIRASMPELFGELNTQTGQILDDISTTFSGFKDTFTDTFNNLDVTLASTVSSLDSHLASLRKSIQDTADALAALGGGGVGAVPPLPTMPPGEGLPGTEMPEEPAKKWDIGGIAAIAAGITMLLPKLIEWAKQSKIIASLGTLLSGIWARIVPVIAGVVSAIISFVAANPVVAAITALVIGLAFAAYELYKHWDEVTKWWHETWDKVKAKTEEVWEGIKSYLSSAWESIKSRAGEAWANLKDAISSGWDSIKSATTAAWDAIKDVVSAAWEGIKNVASAGWEAIKNGVTAAWEAVKNTTSAAWETIKNAVATAWENIKGVAAAGWEAVKNGITAAWETVKSVTTAAWEAVKNAIGATWDAIKGLVTSALDNVKSLITSAWDTVKSTTQAAWEAIKNSLASVWGAIKNTAQTAFEAVKQVIATAWDAVKSLTTSAWEGIKSTLSTAWEGIKSTAQTVFSAIKDAISQAWEGVKSATSTTWETVKTFLSSTWDAIKNTFSTALEAVKSAVQSGWNWIKDTTTNLWNNIKGFLTSTWDSIKSTGETTWNNLKTALANATEATRTALSNTWDNIRTTLSNTWDNLKERGSSTWEALKASLSEKTNATRDALSDTWNDIRNRLTTTAESVRTSISNTWDNLKSRLSDTTSTLKDTLATRWDEMKSRLTETTSSLRLSLENTWSSIKERLTATAASIRDNVSTTWTNLKERLSDTTSTLYDNLSNTWGWIRSRITDTASSIKSSVSSTWDNLKSSLTNTTDNLRDNLSNTWSNIRSTVSNTARWLQDDLVSTWNNLKTRLLDITDSIKSGLSSGWSNIRSTLSDIADSIGSTFRNLASRAWDWGRDVINGFIRGLKSLHIPTPHVSWDVDYRTIAGIRVPVPDIDIEWYAKGGIFTGPSVIGVGEAGAEAVIPLDRLKAYVMDAMREMLASAVMKVQVSMEALTPAALQPALATSTVVNNNTIHVTINGAQDPRVVWEEFETRLRRKGVRF
ncbi:phage tail tape measure protein, TP901 family [Desulfofundulus kuznetsovii DSM 6115]|uniref:Phage tail tape measure protein, TP901 family n=1 Tax=Desulfofundulus kuznetsovii (strain DSM 6115 / VKM B-1805 / 17) TaxID=760568 RepID=A0AAU8PP67_DESK7|nr:phage tail tape measure protein, TP901 family [Desulfofundulus kuznetsovii DSM 6115]